MDQNMRGQNAANPAAPVIHEDSVDLVELFHLLLHRLWILVLAAVIGALAAGIGTKLFITPIYTARSTIYVFSKSTSITQVADLQLNNSLAADFSFIATTRETINQVIDELDLNTSYGALVGSISVTNPENSHLLSVRVQNPDPKLAADISNTLADVLREQIADIMNTDKPSMVSRAVVPTRPSSPNTLRNTMLGGLVLFLLAAAAIIIKYFADDTITTEEDVRRYLNINILASVPFEKNLSKK